MPQDIPFSPSIPFYTLQTTLGEIDYIFVVRWNTRGNAWYFDLLEEDETPITNGLKVVLGALIGAENPNDNRLAGALVATDLTDEGVEPGFDDLGDRVRVYFYPIEEINAL